MATCRDCKHWQEFSRRRGHHVDEYGYRLCERIECPDGMPTPQLEADSAVVTDLSGCAALRTKADFGCNLFEAREERVRIGFNPPTAPVGTVAWLAEMLAQVPGDWAVTIGGVELQAILVAGGTVILQGGGGQ